MKKKQSGQGRKLLVRGEVVARLAPADLKLVVGGLDGNTGACTHPTQEPNG